MKNSIESQILKQVKTKRGISMRDMDIELPVQYQYTDYRSDFFIVKSIHKLAQWGLIELFDKKGKLMGVDEINDYSIHGATFFLSPLAAEMETTIDFSFTEKTQAIFGEPINSNEYPQLFMLMPFLQELRPVFDDHIRKVATKIGLSSARADDFFTTGSIIRDIWSAIFNAVVIVADCTGRNPNVFYEIGELVKWCRLFCGGQFSVPPTSSKDSLIRPVGDSR